MEHSDSGDDKKRNKIIAWTSTMVVHGLLMICFVFMGLSHQIPPPREYGIEVELVGGGGGGGGTPKQQAMIYPLAPSSGENFFTQNFEENIPINIPAKPVVNPTKPQIEQTDNQQVREETPVVNQQAMFTKRTGGEGGSGGGSGGGTGTGFGTGSGSGTGTGSGSGIGGGHGSGIGDGNGDGRGSFVLNGRPVVEKAYPKAKNNLEGEVKVDFRADKNGNVVYAKAGGRGTTINDPQIWEECEKAAMRSKFKAKSDAQVEEKGIITYRFVLQ